MTLRNLAEARPHTRHLLLHWGALDPASAQLALQRALQLRQRFALTLSLVAPTLGSFGLPLLRQALDGGAVDALYFSGEPACVNADAISAARRAGAPDNVFVDAWALLDDHAGLIRALIEAQGLEQPVRLAGRLGLLACTQDHLDRLPAPAGQASWADYARAAWPELRESAAAALRFSEAWQAAPLARPRAATPAPELYLSQAGLQRLGGWTRLRTLPLRFDGRPVADFPCAFALDPTQPALPAQLPDASPTHASCTVLPGRFAATTGLPALLDVVPAPTLGTTFGTTPGQSGADSAAAAGAADAAAAIELPRQLLQIRRPGGTDAWQPVPLKTRMVFITSNFNKAAFVPAGLYAMLMQTHPQVEIAFTDDASTDASVAAAERVAALLPEGSAVLKLQRNTINRGTYWIRNQTVFATDDAAAVYLINDSDDVSSLQRAWLQAQWLHAQPATAGCFLDIVRVDAHYLPLRLEADIERYGTASLAFKGALIDELGYFENVMRNADTEFIERVRHLKGRDALPWHRYPCLFQVFDGQNLTADIYKKRDASAQLSADHSVRAQHTVLFRRQHHGLQAALAQQRFQFPASSVRSGYRALGPAFVVPGYADIDNFALVTRLGDADCDKLARRGLSIVQLRGPDTRVLGQGAAFVTDLGLPTALRWLLDSRKWHGYLLFADRAEVALRFSGPAHERNELSQALLLSKRGADLHALRLAGGALAKMEPLAEAGPYALERLHKRPRDEVMLAHTSQLTL